MTDTFNEALDAKFLVGASSNKQFPEPLSFELAFMGRSNCGKSSTLNRFIGRKSLARVSQTPGRTREINFFQVTVKKDLEPFLVADLPGYGFAKASDRLVKNWGSLVGSYLEAKRNQRAILLVDIRRSLVEDEFSLIDTLNLLEIPTVIVGTKSDKLSRSEAIKKLSLWKKSLKDPPPLLLFSALNGKGRADLAKGVFPESFLNSLFL
jgi:GTP-binding protein